MVKIAVMGHGVVGSGVAELLRKNAAHIAAKAGEEIVLGRVLDLREFPDLPYADKFTKHFSDILNDPAIQIVVETMGGLTPAYDYVKACLLAGKSVVTSNKELVAQKGDELLAIAREKGLNFLFEASVGGGIPVLRPLDQCLAANEVSEVAGILNGTTNFMLTRMIEDGMQFEEALALAQKRGYAERDPSADIDGLDACRKICILASLAFGKHVYPAQVRTEGIRQVTLTDVRLADALGGVIKLIGKAVRDGEHVHAECRSNLGDRPSYGAEAEDAERFARQLMQRIGEIGEPLFPHPVARVHRAVIGGKAADKGQHHRKHMLRHRVGGIPGHVAHRDPPRLCRRKVNVIISRCKHADEFEIFTGSHHSGGDLRFVAHHGVSIADRRRYLFGRQKRKADDLSQPLDRRKRHVAVRDRVHIQQDNFHIRHILFHSFHHSTTFLLLLQ